MNSSIINSLLSEDKHACMYVYFTNNNTEMCAPVINIENLDEDYVSAQDILLEDIVLIRKEHIIRYNYNSKECDYRTFQSSYQYKDLSNKLGYIKYFKSLFNSTKPITTLTYAHTDIDSLDLSCLLSSLDVEIEEIDTEDHPKISSVCQQYRLEIEEALAIKAWEDIGKIDNSIIQNITASNDLPLAMQLLEQHNALAAAWYVQKISADLASGNTTAEFVTALHDRVAPTASRLRGIEQSVTSRVFPTLRKFLTKTPHVAPRKLFSYYDYKFSIYAKDTTV